MEIPTQTDDPPASQPTGFVRSLTRKDLVVYGLTILTPTAAYPVFGVVQQVSHGHAALSYVVAMGAMLFTALSYGRMAAAFPVAGSTYTYAQQALHPALGFLAGWAMILDYVLVPLLSAVFVAVMAERLMPKIPYAAWAFLFCAFITLVNSRGIKVTRRANEVMLAIMCLSAMLLVAAATLHILRSSGVAGLADARAIFDSATFSAPALALGAGIATLSYLGFDAISTLAEDARDPGHDIGSATVLVCLLQTAICVLVVYLAAVVWPRQKSFENTETAILDVASLVGGRLLFWLTTLVLLVAGVASSLASQAGASRLLYGMGRDRLLPPAIFAYLDPKYATPVRSIWLMGLISFIGALCISFQAVVELVNFGAFAGFVLVNLSVISWYYLKRRERTGAHLLTHLIFPLSGAAVCTYVWLSLNVHSKLAGFAWLAVGAVYLAVRTRGFTLPVKALDLP